MIDSLHLLGAVSRGDTLIHGITNYDVDPGIATVMARGDARFDPSFVAAIHQSPVMSATTTAIADALEILGLMGAAVTPQALSRWHFQKMAQGGTRLPAGKAFTIQQGMMVPRAITAAQGALASMDLQAWALSPDGATAPIIVENDIAIPTPPTLAQRFTVGPVILPTGRINGVTRSTIDPGLNVVVRSDEGEAYDTFCAVRDRTASISVRSTDLDQIKPAESPANSFIGVGPITVFLRGLQRNSMPFADDEPQHIAVTMNECMIYVRSVGGDEDEEQEQELTVEPVTPEDGTDMFALSVNTSIPS